jgi:hypothetical protein
VTEDIMGSNGNDRLEASSLSKLILISPYRQLPHNIPKDAIVQLVNDGYILLDDQGYYKFSEEGDRCLKEFIK